MTIRLSRSFIRQYRKLPPLIQQKVDKQLQRLENDLQHPGARVHKMVNQEDIWEARVDIHYRMTFELSGDVIVVRRVGTHEVYRKP